MSDVAVLSPELIPAFITKTFNHYFGNYNFLKDKFLQEQTEATEEGWIPVETFEKFNKVAGYIKNLAFRKELIEGLSGGEDYQFDEITFKVRKHPDVVVPESPADYWEACKARTAFFSGFPCDGTMEELITFCERYGRIESVNKRCLPGTNQFDGTLFVIYHKQADLKKALVAKDQFRPEYPIKRLLKSAWQKIHDKEVRELKEKKAKAPPVAKVGNVLKVTGLPANADTFVIKEFFKKFGNCAYVDPDEEGNATVRFSGNGNNIGREALDSAMAFYNGKLNILGEDVKGIEVRVLTEVENAEFWKEYLDNRSQKGGKKSFSQGSTGTPKKAEGANNSFIQKPTTTPKKTEGSNNGVTQKAAGGKTGFEMGKKRSAAPNRTGTPNKVLSKNRSGTPRHELTKNRKRSAGDEGVGMSKTKMKKARRN
uniref:HTH La-type RNA-binding domain-containing protein n=1 Tax=Rhabditophanes sp. KR3021 TaxID=114890 RepID=A0AC35U0L8_9BILA